MDTTISPPSEFPNEGPTNASVQQSQPPEQQPSTVQLFERLRAYPFSTDQEFAKGLAIILRHPDVPANEEEISRTDDLVLQAKCFYFSRKENLAHALDFTAYKTWAATLPDSEIIQNAAPMPPTPDQKELPTAPTLPAQEPTYPSSFSHIVELITNGQPIPGIQQIPDTVLEGHDTPSTKPRRQKPWEKETINET